MSNNNFDDVLSSLQNSEDTTNLLRILIDIRKKVDADCPKNKDHIAKIREKGSFKYIISFLQLPKREIINICLSILGNSCLDPKCAKNVITQYNVLSNLNHLLKRFPKDDSINGRVFRLIGNLCQHTDQWANIIIDKKPQIVIHIVKFLKDLVDEDEPKVSEATVIMGVRALRELLNKENLKTLIETHQVLQTVGLLLIKYGNIWLNTKKCEGVLINIIKSIHEFSKYRYYPSILEMRNTPKGDSIAYLSKILLLAPRQVVKIVMNFIKISHLKSDLPIPEIFDSFVEVLRDESIIQEFNSTCEECIKCLCYLLDHPGNRENERCGDCIPILISVLQNLTFESNRKIESCLLIISSLNKCKYNSTLIADQIKCNIISILIEKLKLIFGAVDPLNFNHKSDKKRSGDFLVRIRDNKKCKFFEEDKDISSNSEDEIDQLYSGNTRYDYSPASSNESEAAVSWTAGLSPQSSPGFPSFDISETDSDDYSPVCSEVDPTNLLDDDDFTNPEVELKNDIPDENEAVSSLDSDSTAAKHMKIKVIMEIMRLIKIYVKIRPPVTQLGTPELLLALIKSSCYVDWSHSSVVLDILDVICKILDFHDHLLPLMQSDIIPTVSDLVKIPHGHWCSRCHHFSCISLSVINKISKIAESDRGKGDIAHKLLRGDNVTKQQLVLVIPYIVRNKPILTKLMLNCGGLEILMKLLKDGSSHLKNRSIKVLCVLAAKTLRIPNPKTTSSYKNNLNSCTQLKSSTIVTFKLDDGSFLNANRELLSKNSDFFARLLNGDFKESSQDIITLPNVTSKALNYLLEFMKSNTDKSDHVAIDLDLNTHLDVIGLCDRFLMEDHRVYLTDCVEKFRLSFDTIPTIYNWSLESRTNLLRIECIAFALVGNIIDSDRFEMFKNLFDLGYTEELVEDIRKLLVRYLTVTEFCE